MVKGISRRVVVVDAPEHRFFEQAIFIVRNDAAGRGDHLPGAGGGGPAGGPQLRVQRNQPLFQPVADPEPHRIHPDRRRDHRPCLAHRSAGLSKKSTFSFEKRTCFFV